MSLTTPAGTAPRPIAQAIPRLVASSAAARAACAEHPVLHPLWIGAEAGIPRQLARVDHFAGHWRSLPTVHGGHDKSAYSTVALWVSRPTDAVVFDAGCRLVVTYAAARWSYVS
jgi:hypothetical protein